MSLAAQTNAVPLPSVPEVFGVRLPPSSECLTSVDFDLVPNKPPPGVKLYDEEIEEVEESDEDDEDMEPAAIPSSSTQPTFPGQDQNTDDVVLPPVTVGAPHTPSDVDMMTPAVVAQEDVSDAEDEDGLFAGGDEEDDSADEAMDVTAPAPPDAGANGLKRKLVEEDDYD